MKSFIVGALVAAIVATPAVWGQVVIGTGTVQNTTTGYPTPYGNFYKGMRFQCLILASELTAAGASAAQFTTVGWDVVTPGNSGAGAPLVDFTIKMGNTSTADLGGGWDSACLSPVFGPVTYTDVPGWNDHTLTTPFSWNGTSNVIIEVCFWNGSASSYTNNAIVNQTTTTFTSSLTEMDDVNPPCGAGSSINYYSTQRPNVRFTLGGPPIPPGFQVNTTEATFHINGVGACDTTPAIVSQTTYSCGATNAPVTGTFTWSSNGAPGAYYETVMDTSPVVGLGSGGTLLGPGNILNLSVASFPNWTFLNGGTTLKIVPFAPWALPGTTGATINVGYSISSALDISLQSVFVAPTIPSGLRLTQASEFHVNVGTPLASLAGPTSTTTNIMVNVTQGETCWAAGGIPFYGTVYSEMYVSPNGFVCFGGGGDTDTTPSVADALADDARVGFWTDFDPSEGGTIDLLNPAPDIIRVEWNGVWYNTGGPANTFSIEIDCATGVVIVDSLLTLALNAGISTTDDQWLGISPGLGLATDPGSQVFLPTMSGGAALPTDMLYEFNDTSVSLNGLPASVLSGLNQLIFSPDGAGNYNWNGF